ncbi:transglutaminaseTgpA domain-containing protein [Arthrobacter alpinus]|nr:transglutaminaseTgpA domain-containing protein [Arthrobacter alpinus]
MAALAATYGAGTRSGQSCTGSGGQSRHPRTETLTVITTEGLRSEWLPAPAGTVSVEELGGNWRWNPATATIKGAGSTTSNKSYVVRSEVPELTPARLGLATGKPRSSLDKMFTTLPADVPKIVKDTAKSVAGSAATPFAEAMALQNYLRSDAFTYSLDTPAEDGYDGSGMEVLAAFLKTKSGYCVHFSAAMAVMARELGIPSRIAVGYAPGAVTTDVAERDGRTLFGYRATGRDAHAWPELYFEGLGWVPFEPTPSRGSVPEYEQEADSSVPLASAAPLPAPRQRSLRQPRRPPQQPSRAPEPRDNR